jgi:hypothetical protein
MPSDLLWLWAVLGSRSVNYFGTRRAWELNQRLSLSGSQDYDVRDQNLARSADSN